MLSRTGSTDVVTGMVSIDTDGDSVKGVGLVFKLSGCFGTDLVLLASFLVSDVLFHELISCLQGNLVCGRVILFDSLALSLLLSAFPVLFFQPAVSFSFLFSHRRQSVSRIFGLIYMFCSQTLVLAYSSTCDCIHHTNSAFPQVNSILQTGSGSQTSAVRLVFWLLVQISSRCHRILRVV